MDKFELEERLINFSVLIIEIVKKMPEIKPANHLGSQLLRSGTSAALNYGEAQGGESLKDFIHKLKLILKELRESHINLKIILKSELLSDSEILFRATKEVNELISIFVKSIKTASQRSYIKTEI